MKEGIISNIIDVTFGVSFFLFCFCHDAADCLSDVLIGQWWIVTIMVIYYIFQHLCIIFIFSFGHAFSFKSHVKSVQRGSTTLVYVKIAQHFICNWRFHIHCLVICVFLFVYIYLNAFLFVFLFRTSVNDDAFWFRFLSSIKKSLMMMPFDSSSSMEQIYDKV